MSATTVAPPPVEAPPELAPSRGRRKVVLLALVALVLAGAAAWWFLLAPAPSPEDGEVAEGAIVTLDPLTTTTGQAGIAHARITIALVLTDGGDEAAIAPKVPLLQDALLRAVAERDADTLRSAAGSSELRDELTAEARRIWSEEEISRVVLTELLVQ